MSERPTWDEMKLARDGHLAAGPSRLRTVTERRAGWRFRWLYRLADEYDEPNNPTDEWFGGHRYVLVSAFSVGEKDAAVPTPDSEVRGGSDGE